MSERKIVATDSCNCTWTYCAHHEGKPCSGVANGVECDNDCKEPHWIGDGIFGEGLHLCDECSKSIWTMFSDFCDLMTKCQPYIPKEAYTLHNALQTYFDLLQSSPFGWQNPVRDVKVVLQFLNLVITFSEHYKKEEFPMNLIKETLLITLKLSSLETDFKPHIPEQKGEPV